MLLLIAALLHPVPFSYLDIRLQDHSVDVFMTVHIYDLAHDLQIEPMERLLNAGYVMEHERAIRDLLGPRLRLLAEGHELQPEWLQSEIIEDRQSVRFHLRYPTAAAPGMISLSALMFPYDTNHQTFVNVYESDTLTSQLILDRNHIQTEYFAGTRQGTLAVIRKFIPAGIHHILIGPDHLLFLVGLLLLGGSIRRLTMVVTSFTIAHSITLSLAALNIFTPPARIIEPAIALSIVYVGADNLLTGTKGRDVRAWVALLFGLVHGFGFASVLRETGLPNRALGMSLFSFNLGVEIGQAMIVVVVSAALALVRQRDPVLARRIATVGSIGVMMAGAYWFFERVF